MVLGFDDLKEGGTAGLGLKIEGSCGLKAKVWARSDETVRSSRVFWIL